MIVNRLTQKSKHISQIRLINKISWTFTDEAPALASQSILPIIKRFIKDTNIGFEVIDISLASRILSQFNMDNDGLMNLENLVKSKDANIIKLPNVSSSIPQLDSVIKELQYKGYSIPNYTINPVNDDEMLTNEKFNNVLGSAVNPVIREGNSDRRVPSVVKKHMIKNPNKLNSWDNTSNCKVIHMNSGDFYQSEKSMLLDKNSNVSIVLSGKDRVKTLKSDIKLKKGDVVDTAFMSISELIHFYKDVFQKAKQENIMLSLHLKATMMKKSDPVIFGKAIETYFSDVFSEYSSYLKKKDINPNNGLNSIFNILDRENSNISNSVKKAFIETLNKNAKISYVDSEKQITNFHSPSNVIIDASMPLVIRDGGKMWNLNNELEDTWCIIPDRSYAQIYKSIIENCKRYGELDACNIGSVSNVGLMAQKAEEYGSHDKTFQIPFDGIVEVYDGMNVFFKHKVKKGDIWRMCITKKESIEDWINLAQKRNKLTNEKTIFWLDENREHDKLLSKLVKNKIKLDDNILIKNPDKAMTTTLQEIRSGNNIITVTGNVLRDYLTDLFPILELGTSAKMLSIVSLLKGGSLFETGAGGTAPKHVEQLINDNHLRWDSIGEYLALSESLKEYGIKNNNSKASLLSKTLDLAIEKLLAENKFPSRKVFEIDNRGSNFYLALYWSEFLSQRDDSYKELYQNLRDNSKEIIEELNNAQGTSADLGGYWKFDNDRVIQIMNPSKKLTEILEK